MPRARLLVLILLGTFPIPVSRSSQSPQPVPSSLVDAAPAPPEVTPAALHDGPRRLRLIEQATAVAVSETTCDPPDAVRYLLREDTRVYVWFRVREALQGDEPAVEWLRPDGAAQLSQRWPKVANDGNFCFFANLPIAGNEASRRPGEWIARITWNGARLLEERFTILDWTPAPAISAGGVVNGADFTPTFAPGIIFTIYGADLAPATLVSSGTPLPEAIERVQVEVVAGAAVRSAPLLFVSRQHINAQMPFGIAPGPVQVRVKWAGRTSAPRSVDVQSRNPRLFTTAMTGRGAPILVHADYRLVSDAAPAEAGEALVLFLTGLGEVTPPLAAGQAAGDGTPGRPLNRVAGAVEVTIATLPAPVLFAGLAPGFAGLYQVNFTVPQGLASAAHTVRVACGAALSQTDVRMAVRGSAPPASGDPPVVSAIGPQGGRVETDRFRVEIPAQALRSNTSISVVRQPAQQDPPLDELRISGLEGGWLRSLRIAVRIASPVPPDMQAWRRFSIRVNGEEIDHFLVAARQEGDYLVSDLPPAEEGIPASASPQAAPSRKAAPERRADPYFSEVVTETGLTPTLTCSHYVGLHAVRVRESFPGRTKNQSWHSDTAFLEKLCGIRMAVEGCIDTIDKVFEHGWPRRPQYPSEQTAWPLILEYSSLGDEIYGRESPHHIVTGTKGDQYLRLNFDKVAAETGVMKETACHEMFHIVQNLYDPRNSRALRWGREEPWIWFYEASATWFQQFAVSNPAAYVNPEGADEGIDFFRKHKLNFREGADRAAHQEHGYGASAFVQYLSQALGGPREIGDIIVESRTFPDRPDWAIVKGVWGGLSAGDRLGTEWVNFLRTWMKSELFPAKRWPSITSIRGVAPGNEAIDFRDETPAVDKPVKKSVKWSADNYMARLWWVRLPRPWNPNYYLRLALARERGGEVLADVYAVGDRQTRRLGSLQPGQTYLLPDPAALERDNEGLYVMAIHHSNTIGLDDDRRPVDLTLDFELGVRRSDFGKTTQIIATLRAPLLCKRADNSVSPCVVGLFRVPVSGFGVSNWNLAGSSLHWQGNTFSITIRQSNGALDEARGTVNPSSVPPTLSGTFSQTSAGRYTYRFTVEGLPLTDATALTFRTFGLAEFRRIVKSITVSIQDPVDQVFSDVDWNNARDAYVTVGLR